MQAPGVRRRRPFTISMKNISEASGPTLIKFYVNHHWVGILTALGFEADYVKLVVSMATDRSEILTMGKNKKNLLRNHKAQSFHILCVAKYSGPLYQLAPRFHTGHIPGASLFAIGL